MRKNAQQDCGGGGSGGGGEGAEREQQKHAPEICPFVPCVVLDWRTTRIPVLLVEGVWCQEERVCMDHDDMVDIAFVGLRVL